jgi:hypothetical protein
MGAQHRSGSKMKFRIDDEWENLEAPMFCDFLAPEFVGNRLGGQVAEESSSSSFFNISVDTTGAVMVVWLLAYCPACTLAWCYLSPVVVCFRRRTALLQTSSPAGQYFLTNQRLFRLMCMRGI